MGARANWKGFLKIANLIIPVASFKAIDDPSAGLKMNFLHDECEHQINEIRVCLHCTQKAQEKADAEAKKKKQDPPIVPKVEVPFANLVKGYKYGEKFIVFKPEELEELKPESTRTVEVDKFVPIEQIGPLHLDTPYYLAPDGPVARDAYAVLREALRQTKKAALGIIALYGHDQLVAIRPEANGLVMHTVREAKHIRAVEYVSGYDEIPASVNPTHLKMMVGIAQEMAEPFDPEIFEDSARKNLEARIKEKIGGEKIVPLKKAEVKATADLMAQLEASLGAAKTRTPKQKMAKVTELKPVAKRKKAS